MIPVVKLVQETTFTSQPGGKQAKAHALQSCEVLWLYHVNGAVPLVAVIPPFVSLQAVKVTQEATEIFNMSLPQPFIE